MTSYEFNCFASYFGNAKVSPDSNGCYTIIEDGADSYINRLHLDFSGRDDVFVLRQESNKSKSCDLIVVINRVDRLYVFLCEIKTTLDGRKMSLASKQTGESKKFFDSRYDLYSTEYALGNRMEPEYLEIIFMEADNCADRKTPSEVAISKCFNSNKGGECVTKPMAWSLFRYMEDYKNGIAKIPNAYDFFMRLLPI